VNAYPKFQKKYQTLYYSILRALNITWTSKHLHQRIRWTQIKHFFYKLKISNKVVLTNKLTTTSLCGSTQTWPRSSWLLKLINIIPLRIFFSLRYFLYLNIFGFCNVFWILRHGKKIIDQRNFLLRRMKNLWLYISIHHNN